PPVLGLVAHLAPLRVIAVLLAAAGVATGCLQVAALARADPHVGPRRRDRELPYPRERLLVAQRVAVRVDVFERLSARDPPDAGRGIRDVAQARRARGEELLFVEDHGAGRDTRRKTP